jgi:nucleoside-diphosphate-sugar epimerase
MRILIAGGAGFIGSHLTEHHLKIGDTVTVLDNFITGSEDNISPFKRDKNFRIITADVTTFEHSADDKYDIIYNLASPASPVQYKKYAVETLLTNAQGTYRLLEVLRANPHASFVLASTSEIYGDPLVHPQKEDYFGNVNTVGPRSCYDEGKRYAESMANVYVRKYGLNIRIARIFNTYGPHMEKNDGRIISNFIMQALTQKPITIYGDGKQTRSFCYVSDMVQGLYKLATVPDIGGEVINLGNPVEKSVNEMAETIKDMVQSTSNIVHEAIDGDDPKKRKPDISKAHALLKWSPEVKLEDGLTQTIQYFREKFL